MKPFLDWGIEVVLWFQQFSPALDLPFKSLTFLGNLEFFLILMPLIYWCLDRRLGARLLILKNSRSPKKVRLLNGRSSAGLNC